MNYINDSKYVGSPHYNVGGSKSYIIEQFILPLIQSFGTGKFTFDNVKVHLNFLEKISTFLHYF